MHKDFSTELFMQGGWLPQSYIKYVSFQLFVVSRYMQLLNPKSIQMD